MAGGPVRTCVGCRQSSPAVRMVRVARDASSSALRLDRVGPGRGAWLCRGPVDGSPAPECLEQAARRQAFGRAFRTAVDGAVVAMLRENVEERARMDSGGAATATGQRRD